MEHYRLELRRLGIVIKEFETDSRREAREKAKEWMKTTTEAVLILFIDGKEIRLKNIRKELGIRGREFDSVARYTMKLNEVQRILRRTGVGAGGRVGFKGHEYSDDDR